MATNFDDFQKFGKEQLEAVSCGRGVSRQGLQTIATETTDYSKRSLETSSAYLEKLVGAKSLDNAIQIQSEYAKVAYEGFVAQTSKIGELYASLAKEAFKPVESAIAKVQSAGEQRDSAVSKTATAVPAGQGDCVIRGARVAPCVQTYEDPLRAMKARQSSGLFILARAPPELRKLQLEKRNKLSLR